MVQRDPLNSLSVANIFFYENLKDFLCTFLCFVYFYAISHYI